MKITVYLPDDLGVQVQQVAGLNVSAITQRALRDELTRRDAAGKLQAGMKRVEVDASTTHDGDVAFVGRELTYRSESPETTAYLTKNGKIAIHDNDAQALVVFDSFDDLLDDDAWRDGESELLGRISDALGQRYVRELDI